MKMDAVRKHALSLPGVTEEPHFQYSSFRVGGKIFITVPPTNEFIHVFVPEQERELALKLSPEFLDKLIWGKKVIGLKIALATASSQIVKQLINHAWEYKAPKKLRASRSAAN
jgi:hypothetical protein